MSAFLARDLDELLGDQGTGHRSAEQVFVLIDGVGLYTGDDEIFGELVADIEDIEFGGAAVFGPLIQMIELFFLPAVDADADDFEVIVLFEPGNDGCGIKAAAIGKDYFFFLI